MAWDLNSARPIYTQIADVIRRRIVGGVYPTGHKLPSVRDLASEAAVNPNTMQRSFAELEQEGLICTERTAGRFVTEDQSVIETQRERLIRSAVFEFAEKMRGIGVESGQLCEQIETVLKEGDEKFEN
ncbi:MAG: GntR family transcriptional regulator [Oscillospiraceae bacterium]|nr:GntR family transcriptional regulator [Oscillospiraceae bacterium]